MWFAMGIVGRSGFTGHRNTVDLIPARGTMRPGNHLRHPFDDHIQIVPGDGTNNTVIFLIYLVPFTSYCFYHMRVIIEPAVPQ